MVSSIFFEPRDLAPLWGWRRDVRHVEGDLGGMGAMLHLEAVLGSSWAMVGHVGPFCAM